MSDSQNSEVRGAPRAAPPQRVLPPQSRFDVPLRTPSPASRARTRRPWPTAALIGAILALPLGLGLVPLIVIPAAAAAVVAVALTIAFASDRVRRRLRGPVAFVVILAAAVVALDVVARFALVPMLHPRPDTLLGQHHPRVPAPRLRPGGSFERTTFGDLALLTGKPEHREPRHLSVRVDEFGYRNDTVPEAPLDLVLLGDSFGAGSGTTQDETWAAHLGHRGSVYNLSPPWGSPWEQYATAEAELDRLELAPGATVVWSLFAGNDLDDTYLPRFGTDAVVEGPSRAVKTWFHDAGLRSPLRTIVQRVGEGLTVMPEHLPPVLVGEDTSGDHGGGPVLFFREYVERSRRTPLDVRRHRNHELLRRTLHAMHDLTVARGLRLVVVLIPTKADVYPELVPGGHRPGLAFQREVVALASELDVRCLDLRPALRAAAERADHLLYWRDDSHWNPAGHRVAAAAVTDFLRR